MLEGELQSKDDATKIGAIIGLGMAYAGTGNEELKEIFEPLFNNSAT